MVSVVLTQLKRIGEIRGNLIVAVNRCSAASDFLINERGSLSQQTKGRVYRQGAIGSGFQSIHAGVREIDFRYVGSRSSEADVDARPDIAIKQLRITDHAGSPFFRVVSDKVAVDCRLQTDQT